MKQLLRLPWIPAVLLFSLTLGISLGFLPQQPSWAFSGTDGGDYLAAVLTRGVPHPTGYPSYILLNILFQNIPISTPYWRGAFFSACMAAVSSALLYIWLFRQAARRVSIPLSSLSAAAGCLAWSFSPFLFSQAVIVDVHSLHAVFVILGLLWIDALSNLPGHLPTSPLSSLLAFLFGVGLGNHITLLLMLPPTGLVILLSTPPRLLPKRLAAQAASLCLGLLVYLYLPWSASHFPPLNWGNPQSLAGFTWLVSGSAYQGMLWHIQAAELLPKLSTGGMFLLQQVGPPGLLVGILGLTRAKFFSRAAAWSLLWCAAGSCGFALTYSAVDWTTYLLPALLAWCAWICAGTALLWTWRWRGQPVGPLCAILCLTWLLSQLPSTLTNLRPPAGPSADGYVQALFLQAPYSAFIFTSQDLDTFPVWYYHYGLGQRPDLHVILAPLTVFGWYRETIQRTYPDLVIPPGEPPDDVAWESLLSQANPTLAVCNTSVSDLSNPGVIFTCSH